LFSVYYTLSYQHVVFSDEIFVPNMWNSLNVYGRRQYFGVSLVVTLQCADVGEGLHERTE